MQIYLGLYIINLAFSLSSIEELLGFIEKLPKLIYLKKGPGKNEFLRKVKILRLRGTPNRQGVFQLKDFLKEKREII